MPSPDDACNGGVYVCACSRLLFEHNLLALSNAEARLQRWKVPLIVLPANLYYPGFSIRICMQAWRGRRCC
jgi:hypothetical protein